MQRMLTTQKPKIVFLIVDYKIKNGIFQLWIFHASCTIMKKSTPGGHLPPAEVLTVGKEFLPVEKNLLNTLWGMFLPQLLLPSDYHRWT